MLEQIKLRLVVQGRLSGDESIGLMTSASPNLKSQSHCYPQPPTDLDGLYCFGLGRHGIIGPPYLNLSQSGFRMDRAGLPALN